MILLNVYLDCFIYVWDMEVVAVFHVILLDPNEAVLAQDEGKAGDRAA